MLGVECLKQWATSIWQYILSIFYQKELNIVIVGLQNSGKTSLTTVLLGRPFEQDTIPTLGMRMEQFSLGLNVVRIFDLAGQHRFHHIWKRYFERADLIIYVIDLSDLTNWQECKRTLHQVIVDTNRDGIPMLILGNKIDLINIPDISKGVNDRKNQKRSAADLSAIEQWKYMAPLLRNYEFEDIPTYQLEDSNLYVLKNVETLSKELGIDLKNGILYMPESQIYLDRDLAVFTISCKDGEYVQDVLNWVNQL
ncbi:RRM domain-containing protein [Lachancea thermotolerans]|uniref:KLTH0G05654p n=1 Tax=Lachancea thermotolerans (strain ATCC 56472 / CBS 6340 / NRRL Y-8284) TaxID=559295 RepID=C5DM35_LACTC|nr:KLTH0G05654p [Lachancea thermotolerans CBS 6340]CAR24846.1 KLTH0G05654p [Lachancea thermotolerans CBS 6340]